MATRNRANWTTTTAFCSVLIPVMISAFAGMPSLSAQAPDPSAVSFSDPTSIALPIPEDRGQNAVDQALRRLHTTASVMMIVAHPDDEDGPLFTYLSRGLGARCILYTLTRGEGGQNVMTGDTYDALGLIRTSELLKSDQYSGAKQLWGTQADFGFSKTQEEAFAQWGHQRVLYDAVLAVRRARPQVIVATFVGAVSDGHGQHQVSGEIAQEVFKAAGDPKVFPDQLKDGLQPWQPLAVYSMVPFAPINDKGMMFDYATGKWAPAQFHNYVTGEIVKGALSTDATMPVGARDPLLGRSYTQIAREGWGQQKSQNGGANPVLSGPGTAAYHLWAVAQSAQNKSGNVTGHDLFHNSKVDIDTSFSGLVRFVPSPAPPDVVEDLRKIDQELNQFESICPCNSGPDTAHKVVAIYRQVLDLRQAVAESSINGSTIYNLLFELDSKIAVFQSALRDLLGIDFIAVRTRESAVRGGGFRGNSADEAPDSVSPGQDFNVHVHIDAGSPEVQTSKIWFEDENGHPWPTGNPVNTSGAAPYSDTIYKLKVPEDAQPTKPFFTRPSIEQPYYDISDPAWRNRSFAPWPVNAFAEFTYDGVPIRIGEVVQTLQRATGPGGYYGPLVITPAIGVTVTPDARILPLDGSPLPVRVTVHTQAAADGTISLKLPGGWRAQPSQANFHRTAAGDTEPFLFNVTPANDDDGEVRIQVVVESGGKSYQSGWRRVGYSSLRPYNMYRAAVMNTRRTNVKLADGLRIGYVMGPGDPVPDAIEAMGVIPHLLSADELTSGNLSQWNVIVIGIRAYSTRPELAAAKPRLDDFVRNGGTLIVQYQSNNFPAPLPLSFGRFAERVIDERAPVKLLNPSNSLLSFPNKITVADFDGWVEERGHSFMTSWDPSFTPLTETADPDQSPQRGGLLVAHVGRGTYIYVAYALYRQLPELVPGAYRILANLLSAGSPAASATPSR